MKTYSQYKSTGLPWVIETPTHWELVRNKTLLCETKSMVGNRFADYDLLSLTKRGVIVRDISNGKGKFPKDFTTYKEVSEGQIVFCLFDVDETPRTVGISHTGGMITGAYDVFTIGDVNPDFFLYYYITMDNTKALKPLYTSLRKVINVQTFLQTKTPLPPRDEQDQIVRWLDWRTSRINKLVRSKRREIECLKELKKAVISRAVTQGLDANADMKDSVVKWLGNVPAHWSVSTIKKHFRIKKEIAGKEGYDVLSITQHGLKIKNVKSNEGQIAQDYSGYQFVRPGDFAMNHMDLITGYVDYSTLFGVTSPDYRVFQLRDETKDYPHYFLWLLQNCYHCRIFYAFGRGAAEKGRWRLPKENFEAFNIPIPPREEQEAIAVSLDEKCGEIDKLISNLNEEISLVEEYKTRIISDAVTGKIDLRNVEIPDYEAVEEESVVENDTEETEEGAGDEEN